GTRPARVPHLDVGRPRGPVVRGDPVLRPGLHPGAPTAAGAARPAHHRPPTAPATATRGAARPARADGGRVVPPRGHPRGRRPAGPPRPRPGADRQPVLVRAHRGSGPPARWATSL